MIKKLIHYNILIQLITLITSIVVARSLGAEGRGILALILLYPQTIANIFLLGFDRGFSISFGKKELKSMAGILIVVTLILTLLSWPFFFIVANYNLKDENVLNLSILYSAYIPMFFVYIFSISILQGIGDFNLYNKLKLFFYLSYLLLMIVFLYFSKINIDNLIYINLLSVFLVAILAMFFIIGVSKKDNKKFSKKFLILSNNSYIFILPMAIGILSTKVDYFILAKYYDNEELGLFVIFLAVSRLINPITNAFNTYIFHKSITETYSFLNILKKNILIYMVLTLLMYFAAEYIVFILYGDEYTKNTDSLKIIVISSFFFFITQIISEYYKGKKYIRIDIFGNIIFILAIFLFFLIFKNFWIASFYLFSVSFLFAEIFRASVFSISVIYSEKNHKAEY